MLLGAVFLGFITLLLVARLACRYLRATLGSPCGINEIWQLLRQLKSYFSGKLRADTNAFDVSDAGRLALEIASRLRSGQGDVDVWRGVGDKRLQDARTKQASTKQASKRFSIQVFERLVKKAAKPKCFSKQIPKTIPKQVLRQFPQIPAAKTSKNSPKQVSKQASAIAQICVVRVFCEEIGAQPEQVLEQVAAGLSEARRAADERNVMLAGPRATARMFAALPPLCVLVATFLGVPLAGVYADLRLGTVSALTGCLFYTVGLLWMRKLNERATRSDQFGCIGEMDLAVVADMIAAGLESGSDIPACLAAVGKACEEPALEQVSTELLSGNDWRFAWRAISSLGQLASALRPGWCDGVAPVPMLKHFSQTLRAERGRAARASAARLGVATTLPLGLCMLPAFVLLLIVPLVVASAAPGTIT